MMDSKLAKIGMVLSGLYAVLFVLVFHEQLFNLRTLDANEVGDFFAGVFGPLAILWLILGFFQQGKELQQNTKALELQAEELRNSVEQQTRMAVSSETQMQFVMDGADHQRRQDTRNAMPRLILTGGGSTRGNYVAKLENRGATISHLELNPSKGISRISKSQIPSFVENEEVTFTYSFVETNIADVQEIKILYKAADGQLGEKNFQIIRKMVTHSKASVIEIRELSPGIRNELIGI